MRQGIVPVETNDDGLTFEQFKDAHPDIPTRELPDAWRGRR